MLIPKSDDECEMKEILKITLDDRKMRLIIIVDILKMLKGRS